MTLKDEKIEKPLAVAVIGGGAILGTIIKAPTKRYILERSAHVRQCHAGGSKLLN